MLSTKNELFSSSTNGPSEPCTRTHILHAPAFVISTTPVLPVTTAVWLHGSLQSAAVADTKYSSRSFRPLPVKLISVGTPTTTRSGVRDAKSATFSTTSEYRMNSAVSLKR